MKHMVVQYDGLLKTCQCGKRPEIWCHYIKGTANRVHFYVRCECGLRTRSRRHMRGAIEDWRDGVGVSLEYKAIINSLRQKEVYVEAKYEVTCPSCGRVQHEPHCGNENCPTCNAHKPPKGELYQIWSPDGNFLSCPYCGFTGDGSFWEDRAIKALFEAEGVKSFTELGEKRARKLTRRLL